MKIRFQKIIQLLIPLFLILSSNYSYATKSSISSHYNGLFLRARGFNSIDLSMPSEDIKNKVEPIYTTYRDYLYRLSVKENSIEMLDNKIRLHAEIGIDNGTFTEFDPKYMDHFEKNNPHISDIFKGLGAEVTEIDKDGKTLRVTYFGKFKFENGAGSANWIISRDNLLEYKDQCTQDILDSVARFLDQQVDIYNSANATKPREFKVKSLPCIVVSPGPYKLTNVNTSFAEKDSIEIQFLTDVINKAFEVFIPNKKSIYIKVSQ
ncbi:MAG: hypothetical protein CL677_08885 [Bdellovibrionaceae bacterium]|nr:hypothetical protein [Pseudobdellovibrionaceae bacterium]|tara:strand:+ start:34919 stop:35710 length:792 start_codon:yes stop_codon:yes gene_type:complete